MSTALLAAEQELSKQIGDYWASTTTSVGTTTTLVDTALKAKQNDWITKESYDFITSEPAAAGTQKYEERLISSLANSSGTLTVLAHSGIIDDGDTHVDYEVHRLFSPSEKRRALIAAARQAYPHIFKEVRDESLVSGNWLKDGSFEIWTSSSALTYWTATTVTVARTPDTPAASLYRKHGTYSAKLSGSAGTLAQSITNNDDLKYLAGKSVKFSVQVHSTTATLTLSISDGTTTTTSSYCAADTAWTENNDPLEVEAVIKDSPSAVTFTINYASGTAYIDDARVISGDNAKIYIGNLGLARNTPHQVLVEPADYYTGEPWSLISGIEYDVTNGYMYLPDGVTPDYRLRVIGIGYLDFLTSAGVSSDTWTNTIAIDKPQLDILIAQAALYLYTEMSMPNFTQGTREKYMEMMGFWKAELRDRIGRFGMIAPSSTISRR